MIIKSSWYITNVFLFLYDEWKNKLFHPNYIYNQMFFFSFFPFFTISSNKPVLLDPPENTLDMREWSPVEQPPSPDDSCFGGWKIADNSSNGEGRGRSCCFLCCCWCGLRLNMLFALAKYSSFLFFFAIMILKTFIHYCWFV